jgi:hypothetical protein
MNSRGAVPLVALGAGVLISLAALFVSVMLYWIALPPLSIERAADGVKVHVERLGEYNSALTEFAIFDGETQAAVVRFIPRENMIAMWTLQIHDGPNEVAPSALTKDPGYIVQIPFGGAPALFKKGHLYRVAVKGFSMFGTELLPLRLRRTATFVL